MESTPGRLKVAMEAQFSCWYHEMKSLLLTRIDSGQWAKIEMELGIADNIQSQSDVSPAAELPSPSPSSTNMATSSVIANAQSESGTGSNTVVQPS